jgi:hypothetical protein
MITSLKQLKFSLQDIIKRLEWKMNQNALGQRPVIILSELNNLRHVINDIESLTLFESVVASLKNSAIFTTSTDQINVEPGEGHAITTNLDLLKTLLTNFLNLLLKTVPDEDPNSINIKLPPVNDFDELSKVSHQIHIALTLIVLNEEIGGQTKIVSVENGSIWLNVYLGVSALPVVASVVWAAAVIYKKIQEGRIMEQHIRALKVKNDSLEDVLKAQKAETNLMIQAEAEHIQSESFTQNAQENIERIKNSISIFADLIDKGAEIHPALVAQENVANLFPDPMKLVGLESKIKKIGNPS